MSQKSIKYKYELTTEFNRLLKSLSTQNRNWLVEQYNRNRPFEDQVTADRFNEGKIAFTCSSKNKRFATIILALEISAFAFSSALGFSDHSAAACTEISKEGK